MSSHHDHDQHSQEPKKVAFRTPLILGLVTIFIILLAVSTCDNKHHGSCQEDCSEECMKKCEAGDKSDCSSKHEEGHEATSHGASHSEEHVIAQDTLLKADSTATKKEEAHANHH
jgi:hypothetical protein